MNELAISVRVQAEISRRDGLPETAKMLDSAANEIETLSERVRRLEAEVKELKVKGKE